MKLFIDSAPNPSGAYPNPKMQPFPGCIELNDEQSALFLQYNGFVAISDDKVTPNTAAWENWKAAEAEKPVVGSTPTQLDRVEAQVTYTAMMTDTLLEV